MMVKMVTILIGDCLDVLKTLPDCSVHCCVTSPPYWGLRDYGVEGQWGMERTPEEYVAKMVAALHEVRRVLRDDGTLWLNLGDSYAATTKGSSGVGKNATNKGTLIIDRRWQVPPGIKPKDLIGIPWRVAFALQADGWYLRQDIIWHKPNPMPESVRDRCTKAHEYVFLLSKKARYYYDNEAIREDPKIWNNGEMRAPKCSKNRPSYNTLADDSGNVTYKKYDTIKGANRRSVWTITPKPYRGAHFAVMPPDLAELCIKASTSAKGCCPKCGTPWQRVVERAKTNGRRDPGGSVGMADAGMYRGRAGVTTFNTTGWRPACDCGGDPVPCTVLDPFGGSGTTGYVASRNGRCAIIVELNPEYAKLAHDRCG